MLIGRIIGKTSPESYNFEVTGIIRKMDFVATRDPEKHWVLGRIDDIIQQETQTTATVSVIGYADKDGVKMPRMPFKPNTYVYKADDGLIKRVLGLKNDGLYIGLLDGSEKLKVYMDPKLLMTKHLAILAKSGFGKSYLTGVILEEYMEKEIPAVVIDPHGEYLTLRNPNKNQSELKYMPLFDINSKGYVKEVELYCLDKNLTEGARRLKLRGKLTHQEILDMLPFKLSPTQLSIIYTAVSDSEKQEYTLDELKREVMKNKSPSKWSVIPVLDLLKSTGLFDIFGYANPHDLVKKGKISIINLKGIEPDIQQIVVYKLAKDLFHARKMNKIPPFMFIIEEAHNFAPERGFGEAISSRIIRTIASEGRKFGMGLGVITQRPARIDKNVLSQCTTQIFLRVTNPNDLKSISDSVEGITKGLESQIKILPVGTACVVGLIEQPLLVNVRIKRSEHGGTPVSLTEKFKEQEESADILYFYPKFLEEDIKKIASKDIEKIKMIYYPLYYLKCKFETPEGDKIDNIFVDGFSGELVYLNNNLLERTEGLTKVFELDTKHKAVALFLTSYGSTDFSTIRKKLKIKDDELMNILTLLKKKGIVSMDGMLFKSNIKADFEDIIEKQIVEAPMSYKYAGEAIQPKIKKDIIPKVLDIFNPDAVDKKTAFYPFWILYLSDGTIEVVDALTGEKDEYLKNSGFIESIKSLNE
ncbi:MAG: ATP-binding protein [Candidatus Aenigmatarchaeota archaeon]